MDGTDDVGNGDPVEVICADEFGPLNLQPHPSRQWTARGGGELMPRRQRRATYTRPHGVRLGIVLDNFSPHLSARSDRRVADWAAANNVELAYVPPNASWLNRIEAVPGVALFHLDGTDHASHHQQASMIRRYIAWRNQHAHNQRLRQIVDRAKVA